MRFFAPKAHCGHKAVLDTRAEGWLHVATIVRLEGRDEGLNRQEIAHRKQDGFRA